MWTIECVKGQGQTTNSSRTLAHVWALTIGISVLLQCRNRKAHKEGSWVFLMTEGILSVLNGLVEKGVITKDMLPDVISTNVYLEKEYEQNPLSDVFKHMT